MNYGDRELQDRLAAEYVLGTLRGAARRRFETLLREMPELQRAVGDWERRLSGLAEALEPVAPPARLWQRIEARLAAEPGPARATSSHAADRAATHGPAASAGGIAATLGASRAGPAAATGSSLPGAAGHAGGDTKPARRHAPAASARRPTLSGLWENLMFWRFLTAATALGVVVMGLKLAQIEPHTEFAARVAVLQDTGGQTMLLLQIDQPRYGSPNVKAALGSLRRPALSPDKSLELWSVPASGAPKSLGVLPSNGAGHLTLPITAISRDAVLAVSVEPTGGSPTGAPTGPVILQGRVSEL